MDVHHPPTSQQFRVHEVLQLKGLQLPAHNVVLEQNFQRFFGNPLPFPQRLESSVEGFVVLLGRLLIKTG